MVSYWSVVYIVEDNLFYPHAAFVDDEDARSFAKKQKASYYISHKAETSILSIAKERLPEALKVLNRYEMEDLRK